MVFNTGCNGRALYCLLCTRIFADDYIFQHIIDEHASEEGLPFDIVWATVPEYRKRKRE
jgi:hypothetical protein